MSAAVQCAEFCWLRSPKEIRAGYLQKAKTCHPDLHGDSKNAEFQQLTHAYSVLSDSAKRGTYCLLISHSILPVFCLLIAFGHGVCALTLLGCRAAQYDANGFRDFDDFTEQEKAREMFRQNMAGVWKRRSWWSMAKGAVPAYAVVYVVAHGLVFIIDIPANMLMGVVRVCGSMIGM